MDKSLLIINHGVILCDAGQTYTGYSRVWLGDFWPLDTWNAVLLMTISCDPDFFHCPSPVILEDHLSNAANSVHQLNCWDVCVDKGLLRWPHGRKGGEGGGVLCYLGHPPTPHHQQSTSKFSAACPHSWSDLRVISTDNLRETVIRGISQAVFV